MTQTTADFKAAPHWRIFAEDIKQLYTSGILTARGAVYAAIQAARKPGHKLRVKNVKEFGKQLGLSKPSTYRAISELRSRDLIEWTEIGGIDIWIPESEKVVSILRNESHNQECSLRFETPVISSETPSLNIENQTPLKPAQAIGSSDSPNYSFNSSSINSQCSFITHTGEAEISESEEDEQGGNLDTPVKVPDQAGTTNRVVDFASGTFAPAPPSTVLDFENSPAAKCNAMFNRSSNAHEWEDYPGYPKAEFSQWYGDRFYAKAPNAFQSKTDWVRSMLRKPDRAAAAWADYQAEVQASEQVREQIAIPAEPSIEQFSKPVDANNEAEVYRLKAKIGIAQSLGRPLDAATAARAKELGIDVGQVVDVAPAPAAPPVIPPAPVTSPPDCGKVQPQSFADISAMFGKLGLPAPAAEPDDASDVLAEIQVWQIRLGWSEAKLDNFASGIFGVRSRHHLEDDQLPELLEMLKHAGA